MTDSLVGVGGESEVGAAVNSGFGTVPLEFHCGMITGAEARAGAETITGFTATAETTTGAGTSFVLILALDWMEGTGTGTATGFSAAIMPDGSVGGSRASGDNNALVLIPGGLPIEAPLPMEDN